MFGGLKMSQPDGIVDKQSNPFTCNSWATGERRGLTNNPKPEKNLRLKLKKLLNHDEVFIRDKSRFSNNDGVYVAFVAIRWGFAKMIDGILTETEKWKDVHLYDDYGQRKTQTFMRFDVVDNIKQPIKETAVYKPASSNSSVITRDDLIQLLKEFQADTIISKYISNDLIPDKSPRQLLDFTFGPSIYRRFSHERPTTRFINWRWYQNPNELKKRILALNCQEKHDELLYDLAKSLVEDWGPVTDQNQPSKMNIGIALKINNLLLKHFCFSEIKPDQGRIEWLHVPWDKFTLIPISHIWTGNPRIPATASQGFVKSMEHYKQLHSLITSIVKEARIPRIYYELWAWDKEH
jgi:hypothetical protein